MCVLPLLNPFVNGSKGFCLPLRCVFLCVPPCVLQHFTLHLAPKRLAFCTKIACVLHQNAVRFAAYCRAFCCKQPKSWCKSQFYAMQIHIACINNRPLLASKPTFARIEYLRPSWRLVDCKGTHNVKICAENITN